MDNPFTRQECDRPISILLSPMCDYKEIPTLKVKVFPPSCLVRACKKPALTSHSSVEYFLHSSLSDPPRPINADMKKERKNNRVVAASSSLLHTTSKGIVPTKPAGLLSYILAAQPYHHQGSLSCIIVKATFDIKDRLLLPPTQGRVVFFGRIKDTENK
jgi:hypothetical protein